ncbi:MAG: YceI family protein [Bacteroidetes bacterium]|nr:YceI family protein [Bacteroidota bacterium]
MTKNFFLILFLQLIVAAGFSQEYKPADAGSSVGFEIKNLGFNTKGSFTGLDGKIVFDPQDLSKASFDVSIDATSVNTDNSMRDGHLKKDSYFDVEKYPRIKFVSTSVSGPDKSGHYTLSGKLTIKSTTKDIYFPFIATKMGDDYIFKGDFKINRKDFGVGGSSTVSSELTIQLTVLAKKQ